MSDSEMQVEQPAASAAKPGKARRKGKASNQKRQDQRREHANDKVYADIQAKLKAKLCDAPDFNVVKRSLAQIEDYQSGPGIRCLGVPVSTRTIGFFTCSTYDAVVGELGPQSCCSVLQAYRVAMLQLSAQLLEAERRAKDVYPPARAIDYARNFGIDHALQHPSMFVGVAHKINSLGVVELSGRHLTPVIVESGPEYTYGDVEMLDDGRRRRRMTERHTVSLPEASEICAWNIRKALDALEDPGSSVVWRRRFRRQNAIPCLKWNDDNNTVINADEIWPQDYPDNQLMVINDFKCFRTLYNKLNAKRLHDFRGAVKYTGFGDPSMTVVVQPMDIHLIDCALAFEGSSLPPMDYWYTNAMSKTDALFGALLLSIEFREKTAYAGHFRISGSWFGSVNWLNGYDRVVSGV